MSKLIWGLTTVAAFSVFSTQAAETLTYNYKLLSDSRSAITLPAYTVEDKKVVLDQAYLVMNEIFVHRDLKLKHFGQQIDPLPMIKDLEARVDATTDASFHGELTRIFTLQNDLHTSYVYPKPYACYRSLLPLSFKEVLDLEGHKVIAVKSLTEVEDILKLVPEVGVEVGDILVSYNGVPAYEAVKNWGPHSGGANPEAKTRRSVSLLSMISQKYEFTPKEDAVQLVLKNRHGQTYSVAVPWITKEDVSCLKPATATTASLGEAADDYQNEFNRTYRSIPKRRKGMDSSSLKTTAEPILTYKIVQNEFGAFAYISLESFMPEKLTVDEVVLEIKNLLHKELAKTDGLIFDLRNNGGGQIFLAESMVQLFTPKNPTPMNFRLKNSPANLHFMKTVSPYNRFTEALKAAEATGAPFAADLPLDFPSDLDKLGQFYFKPVALLTNANCYSSCDMFTALMQDHEAAIIFGEDSTTGAGGANNRYLVDTVTALKENLGPYKKLPGEQNIVFAFRQVVRTGPSLGVLVEDVGVLSDKIAAATLSDLYTDSGDQFKIIAKALNERAQTMKAWVKITDKRTDVVTGEMPEALIKWNETDEIRVMSGDVAARIYAVEESNISGKSFALTTDVSGEKYSIFDLEILGSFKGKRVWRKRQQYRTTPPYLSFQEAGKVPLSSFVIYNIDSPNDYGWKTSDGSLRVGDGVKYSDYVKSEASVFLELKPAALKLKFDAEIETEKDFDFFRMKLVSEGKEVELVKGESGKLTKSFEFDLSAYQGKKIELRFVFESDGGEVAKGVELKNIAIE